MCRGSAEPAVDTRDKPEHDERGVGRLCQQSGGFQLCDPILLTPIYSCFGKLPPPFNTEAHNPGRRRSVPGVRRGKARRCAALSGR
ncbi:hypothetical protein ELG83_34415 (plasmid) [Rhizobium leguminosarum]|uniref:Uncharacterized protein n=1 Tax=Rhizobium leguminosarum bv. viciae TaxID=387 RepID=A0A8G2IXT8_RHILV|nr:hypothetical protein [Rhizobium leguminosarum bv. viciae]TBF23826.1 hypothetical protein ELG88_34425 [Rhizobium leguminosarum]NKK23674.1 hypothetical protein [Rhizobium leguminosarum bv. viciae]NKK52951.1 hypothetical protein [Rhizobium leguminosarum bv. viciae]TBF44141.1 hypothetical protein ELG87_36525 [Rhizobium leguminosarum]